jgi:carbon-monoxide dehydrogenase small subunit
MKKAPKRLIAIQVNGNEYEIAVHPNRTLLEVLREDLRLTGTKEGCDEGSCGACTVLLDGVPVRSCLCLALEVQGRAVTTIEGLAEGPRLHPVQEAFIDQGAIQCGYCSPGMILTAKALLDRHPDPTVPEIQQAISGNICRCTGYNKIVTAIQTAAQAVRGGR